LIALLLTLTSTGAGAAATRETLPSLFPVAPHWTVEIGSPPVNAAFPVSDDARVYVALRNGTIVARAIRDGAEVWHRSVTTERPIAIDGELLFVAEADRILALRAATGETAWERPFPALTAPIVAKSGWLMLAAGQKLTAVRAKDGSPLWELTLGSMTAPPSIDGDRVYVSVADGRVLALGIENGSTLWQQMLEGPPAAPLGAGDRVYVGAGDRRFYCLKARDGEVDWSWRIGALVIGRPAVSESNVYFVALDNVVRALDRQSGVQQWQHALRRRASSGPVLVRGIVLVPSSSSAEIYSWTEDEGKPAGTIQTPAEPAVPPDVEAGTNAEPRMLVVTGNLTGIWQLTLIGAAVERPMEPLAALPGTLTYVLLGPPMLPLTELPGRPIELR
jgi:outer membrane protein assembly factor BamB